MGSLLPMANCYQSVGVTQIPLSDTFLSKATSHAYRQEQEKDTFSYYQGHGNWNLNQVITVTLNCEDWTVTYFRGREGSDEYVQFKRDNLKKGKYFFVVSVCGGQKKDGESRVHLKSV